MSTDERNFRSAYYEKVGFKSVEEKKSIEILLKEKILDKARLKQFCLRFSVPPVHRNIVWKVLLGVLPIQIDCHEFVMDQRRREYLDLKQAIQVLRLAHLGESRSQMFLAIWLLHTERLRFGVNLQQMENGFTHIVEAFQEFFTDEPDVYWLAKLFYASIGRIEPEIPKLIESTFSLLEREDELFAAHLDNTKIFRQLRLEKWFDNCFANLLDGKTLERLWDKLIGGCYKILVFVAVVLLMQKRSKLLKCKNIKGALILFERSNEESSDIVISKAIEMWQQHGSPLTLHDKPKPQ